MSRLNQPLLRSFPPCRSNSHQEQFDLSKSRIHKPTITLNSNIWEEAVRGELTNIHSQADRMLGKAIVLDIRFELDHQMDHPKQ